MNIKIAGQSSKSNYHNTGSCGGAVIYNEHELRLMPQLFRELGVQPEDLAWFDMDGHVVTGAEVMDKIGRLTGHLGKNDAKFYCTMINPSDDEALAMGATVDEQITNGRPFVFDVMDAYAENFHREGVKDRHDLVAFAIPHVFKSEEKQQIHWHVIQARKDATNKYKLSPLTNHKNTTKGAVHGGFDRVAFDAECERRFDIRYNYERRVEQSFDYLLAEKKGTVEEKAVQETRLALQNLPELKESIQAAISRRVERLAKEAAERANKERQAQEKAARAAEESRLAAEKAAKEALRQEQNDIIEGYRSAVLPVGKQLYSLKRNAFELYREAKDSGIGVSAATAAVHKQLVDTWKLNDDFGRQTREAKDRSDAVKGICGILTCLNPIVGLTAMLLAGIVGDIHRASLVAQQKKLLVKVNSLRGELTDLEAKKAALTIQKQERLRQYLDAKRMYKEYRDSLQTVDREAVEIKSDIRAAEERNYIRRYVNSDKLKGLLDFVNRGFDETHYDLVPGHLVETETGMRLVLYSDGFRSTSGDLYNQHDPAPQDHGKSYIDFSVNAQGQLLASVECDPSNYYTYGVSGVLNISTGDGSVARRDFRGSLEKEKARKQKSKDTYAKIQGSKKKPGEKKTNNNNGPSW